MDLNLNKISGLASFSQSVRGVREELPGVKMLITNAEYWIAVPPWFKDDYHWILSCYILEVLSALFQISWKGWGGQREERVIGAENFDKKC